MPRIISNFSDKVFFKQLRKNDEKYKKSFIEKQYDRFQNCT